MSGTAIVILAAGSSSRLSRPKQLLMYKGKTLLQRVVDEAEAARLSPVIVVTGHNAQIIAASLIGKDVLFVENANWAEGMASGIVAGLSRLLQYNKKTERLVLAVCDQPYVSAGLFRQLLSAQTKTGKGIVASHYNGINGTPVLFTQKYFPRLQSLNGNEGARKVLKFYYDDVATVSFAEGATDIDTEEDYQKLLHSRE